MLLRLSRIALSLRVALLLVGVALAGAPPTGFSDTPVVSVASPTALAFTPDGRLLIASQTGQLYVFQNGTLTTALDLRAPNLACVKHERGLLGVAVDPAFATNHYLYLYYTFNKFPDSDPLKNCPDVDPTNPSNPVNRVSRFVLPASNAIDLASEFVLIDNIPSTNGNHNAGDLHFGKDGYLYISIGDGGCDYTRAHSCAGGNRAARDPFILLGKILRITSDGGVPPSNPWMGADSARCYDPAPGGNKDARNADGKKCQETFAWGLRNPFRFAIDPNAAVTRLLINDVGQGTWEEIDEAQAGADYGWPIREGFCAEASATNCSAPPAGMTNPIYAYQHGTAPNNCNAITGGALVPSGVWPWAYESAYLYGDHVCGKIFTLVPDGAGGYTSSAFVTGVGSIVAMTFGPYNSTQALYYTTYSGGGQVRRIAYTGSANRAPTAVGSADPTSGSAPLSVNFSAAGSSDPDGDALTYDWDFGDGSLHAVTATASHQYATGTYTASLQVSDGHGGSASATVRIDSGNTAPVPAITAPDPSARYRVGQSIALEGRATDAQDGALDSSRLSWRVILHHNDHTHPFVPPTPGSSITITAPPPEDLAATAASYLEVELTATDSRGLSSVITEALRPNLVNLTFATAPVGLRLSINDITIAGQQTLLSWEGYQLNAGAADQTDALAQLFLFDRWSDGGAAGHIITTPAAPAMYTATFRRPAEQTAYKLFLPLAIK